MPTDGLIEQELREAAAAHVAARREGGREAQRLAHAVEAATQSGMTLREIAEIVSASTREALLEPRLAA